MNSRNRRGAVRPLLKALFIPLAAGTLAISCKDEPTAPAKSVDESALAQSKNLVALSCFGDREKGQISCSEVKPDAPKSANPNDANIILGNQGLYIDIVTNNVNYNSGTGDFTFDLKVRNRITQALGTTDGTTLDPSGVRVFFNSGPTVTAGSGVISVIASTATFTAPGQPYYQYNEVLSQFELSPALQWKLNMPSTVTTFAFGLLVNAAVQFPDGYIDLQPNPFLMNPGTDRQVSAVVRNANGEAIPGAPVTWSSSNTNVLVVDATGRVIGVKSGVTTVIATSGTRVGTTTFTVGGIQRVWNGSVDTDWNNAANWNIVGLTPTAQTPSDQDTAVVPGGLARYPLFVQNNTVGGVIMQDGASIPTIDIGPFDFTLNSSIDHATTGTISGSGRMIFAGTAKTISGGASNVDYRNARFTGTYSLNANLNISGGKIVVQGGRLRNSGISQFRIRVRPN